MTKRILILAAAAALVLAPACSKKESTSAAGGGKQLKVGFAQTGAESAWRTANTISMKTEAEKRGVDFKFADGAGKQENQIRAVRSFIAQKCDAIVIAPIVETGWDPVLREAKAAGIPVIITDRTIQTDDESLYRAFLGSDFYTEGKMAADWLAKKTDGKCRIVELQGTPGSAPANERRRAFADAIAKYPGMTIVDSQSGDFRRAGGKEVMEAMLKKHGKDIDVVYAHNDDMALGAAQAIEEAGMKPGKDIILVSIDGIHDALQAIIDGRLNCSVECNPLFGPRVFDLINDILAGKNVPKKTYNKDELFDSTNAAQVIASRKY